MDADPTGFAVELSEGGTCQFFFKHMPVFEKKSVEKKQALNPQEESERLKTLEDIINVVSPEPQKQLESEPKEE